MRENTITLIYGDLIVEIRLNEEPEDENKHHLVIYNAEDVALMTFSNILKLAEFLDNIDLKTLNILNDLDNYI